MADRGGGKGVLHTFYENSPYISMVTAIIYIFYTLVNELAPGGFALFPEYSDTVLFIMLVGAILFIPLVFVDIAFTGTLETGELAMVGITNFIALVLAYYKAATTVVMNAAYYAMLIYVIMFIVSLIAFLARRGRK